MKLPKFTNETALADTLKTPSSLESYEKTLIEKEIFALRKKTHMTQKELASKLKTTQSVIARMETGKQNFTIGTLIKLGFILKKKLHVRFL